MNSLILLFSVLPLVALMMTAPVQATEPSTGLYVHLGIAGILFDTNASTKVAGLPLPDANLRATNNVTPSLGIGYFFTPNISLEAIVGVPPKTTLTGIGGLTLGKVTYGPTILAADYHFRQFGAFQPYVGVGMSYSIIFGTEDRTITNLKAQNSFGAVLRAGFDVMLSDRWGVFFAASKVFTAANVSGTVSPAIPKLGGAPTSAHINLNPVVLFSGVTYRF